MKFLHEEESTWIGFHKIKAKRSGGDLRTATMEFALQLDGINTKKMPSFIADAWASMRRADSGVILQQIERKIDSQNLQFYATPDDKSVRMEIEEVDLFDLRLERTPDKKVFMFFTITQEIGAELWKWIGQTFGREIAVAFEECQIELKLESEKPKAKTASA